MIDLGVNGFIEKVESHFGKWVTKALLFVIILTIVVVCLNTLWTMAVAPFVESVKAIASAQSINSYWDLIKTFIILVLAVALSASLVRNWIFGKSKIQTQKFLEQMSAKIDSILEHPETRKVFEEIRAEEALKNSTPKNSIVSQVVEDPPLKVPDTP